MAVELPTTREWLDEVLKKRGMSQNQLGRRMHPGRGGSSQVSTFAAGHAGPQICLDIARALDMDPTEVLAVAGHIPPPARMVDLKTGTLAHRYALLNETNRAILMDMARILLSHQRD
jgi:hypothetical protein